MRLLCQRALGLLFTEISGSGLRAEYSHDTVRPRPQHLRVPRILHRLHYQNW
jgi:hypothetical protein